MLFTSLSADELQLNLKSAYIPRCVYKNINMHEFTSAVIREFKKFSCKKIKTYIKVFKIITLTKTETFQDSNLPKSYIVEHYTEAKL